MSDATLGGALWDARNALGDDGEQQRVAAWFEAVTATRELAVATSLDGLIELGLWIAEA